MGNFKSKNKNPNSSQTPAAHNPQGRRSSQAISTNRNLVYPRSSVESQHAPQHSKSPGTSTTQTNNPTTNNTPSAMLVNFDNSIDEGEYARLEGVQCHLTRIRRRESIVPSVFSIVEDPFLEQLCEDSGQEPEFSADRLSRNDRKRLVSTMSNKIRSQSESEPLNRNHSVRNSLRNSHARNSEHIRNTPQETLRQTRNSRQQNNSPRAPSLMIHDSGIIEVDELRKSKLQELISKPEALHEYLDNSIRTSKLGTSNPGRINSGKMSNSIQGSSKRSSADQLLAVDSANNSPQSSFQSVLYKENSVYQMDSQHVSQENVCNAEILANARLEHFRRSTLKNIRKGSILPDTIGQKSIEDLHLAPTLTEPENYSYPVNSENGINYVVYTAPEHKIREASRKSSAFSTSFQTNSAHPHQPNLPTTEESYNQASQNQASQNQASQNQESQNQESQIHDLSDITNSSQVLPNPPPHERINESLVSKLNFQELPSLHQTFNHARQSRTALDQRPRTSITGYSAYPLPGSDLSTRNGGIYESTKCSRNLLTEQEILQVISQSVARGSNEELERHHR